MEWTNYNKLSINWEKTKFMILTNKHVETPAEIKLENNLVEVVSSFKLLGVFIDNKLQFNEFTQNLIKNVNTKLFSFQKLFFLSQNVRNNFFKTFILPHFDYCLSLFVYFSSHIISEIEKLYNFCIYHLFNIKLKYFSIFDQLNLLKKLNILPFKCRLLLRISYFSYKIMNNVYLNNIKNSLILEKFKPNIVTRSYTHKDEIGYNSHIYKMPFCRTMFGNNCLSYFLPKFINFIMKDTYNLTFYSFKKNILQNIYKLFLIFERLFL